MPSISALTAPGVRRRVNELHLREQAVDDRARPDGVDDEQRAVDERAAAARVSDELVDGPLVERDGARRRR